MVLGGRCNSMSYSIAIYIRLSSSDKDTGFIKKESDSVVGQRNLLNNFLDSNVELKALTRKEYCDDGFSGITDKRPEFIKMIDDVKQKKINLIIVKDFSRFFRDYIEAGNYIECVFPVYGVRFISVNDNYDSNNYKASAYNLDVVMRNIVYGAYSKDISVKTKIAKKIMMQEGKFVGSHAPFGYIMHPHMQNKLAIDNDSAPIVKYIFDLAVKGNNTSNIAKKLNEKNIMTPSKYYKLKNPNDNKFRFTSSETVWTAAQVYLILTNLRYTGALVSNRKEKLSLAENKYKQTEPIIVEKTHEAIVSRQIYEKANLVIKKTGKTQPRIAKEYPLKALVRCGNCKRLMRRKLSAKGKHYFSCVYAYNDAKSLCPKGQTISEETLEKLVLNILNDFLKVSKEKLINATKKENAKSTTEKIIKIEMQLSKLQKNRIVLYEKFVAGNIKRDEYLKKKFDDDKNTVLLSEKRSEIKEELAGLVSIQNELDNETEHLFDTKASLKKISFEIANNFVKSVYVYDKQNIEISLIHRDLFEI